MGFWQSWFGPRDDGPDGATPMTAIVVRSVSEEYDWLDRHCRGFEPSMQALTHLDGKPYDVLTLHNSRGAKRTVYFDISGFFGK